MALVAAVASPLASVICVVLNSRKSRSEAKEQAAITETKQNEILMLCLRTSIHSVYSMYKADRTLPDSVFSGVCQMYNQYKSLGGNCYITALMDEMKGWKKI